MMEAKAVKSKVLRMLARREYSCHELTENLLRKGACADDIRNVLDEMKAKDLLSEERYVEVQVRSRVSKGQGPVRIAMALKQQHISARQIDEGLAQSTIDWQELARQVRSKRFGHQLPVSLVERAKQQRFLQYRGFPLDLINKILD